MSIGYTEKRNLEKMIEIDQESILDLLEDYPGAAILLALEEECVDKVFDRFKEIIKDYREMKRILKYILEMQENDNIHISPALQDQIEGALDK